MAGRAAQQRLFLARHADGLGGELFAGGRGVSHRGGGLLVGGVGKTPLVAHLVQALQQAGFKNVQVEVMPLLNTRFDTNTYSAGMLEVMGAFVTGRDGLTAEDVAAWQADVRSMDQHTGYFFSLNRYVFVATR